MTTGEYIRKLRKSHDMTQEDLGKMLSPPVNRQLSRSGNQDWYRISKRLTLNRWLGYLM